MMKLGRLHRPLALIVSAALIGFALSYVDRDRVASAFAALGVAAPSLAFLLLLASHQLAAIRYLAILELFGQRVAPATVARATFLGALGALAPVSIVGQIFARWAILRRAGLSSRAIILTNLYERVLATIVLLAACLAAALVLNIRLDIGVAGQAQALARTVAVAAITGVLVAATVLRRPIRLLLRRLGGATDPFLLAWHVLLTGLVHVTMLAAYLVMIRVVAPEATTTELVAVIIVVMTIASVPVSFAGWGTREVGALFALGLLSVGGTDAVAVSVTFGAVSTLAILLLAALAMPLGGRAPAPVAEPAVVVRPTLRPLLERAVPLCVALLILFQAWIPLGPTRVVNVNLADPFALVGALLWADAWRRGKARPASLRPLLAFILIGSTGVIALALAVGAMRFGITGWAFANRGAGWLVLLCFFASGCLAAAVMRRLALGLVTRILACAVIVATVTDVILKAVERWPNLMTTIPGQHAELVGEAVNPNAFGLQLLLVFAAVAVAPLAAGNRLRRGAILVFLIAAVIGTQSRTSVIALAAVNLALLALSRAGRAAIRRPLLPLAAVAAALAALGLATLLGLNLSMIRLPSDTLRLSTITGGLELFLEHPILGAGIGAYVQQAGAEYAAPFVIHSTLVWILAETGLVGAAYFVALFLWLLLRFALPSGGARTPAHDLGLLVLLVLAVFSVPHDVLYQRPVWFLLGLALVGSAAAPRPRGP